MGWFFEKLKEVYIRFRQATTRPEELCSAEENSVGTSVAGRVFKDLLNPSRDCHVNGADLKEGGNYVYNGGLVRVDGDVPARTQITAHNGRVEVTGSLRDHAAVSGYIVEKRHDETYQSNCARGRNQTHTCEKIRSIFDGYATADATSGVTIVGHVPATATVRTNNTIQTGTYETGSTFERALDSNRLYPEPVMPKGTPLAKSM